MGAATNVISGPVATFKHTAGSVDFGYLKGAVSIVPEGAVEFFTPDQEVFPILAIRTDMTLIIRATIAEPTPANFGVAWDLTAATMGDATKAVTVHTGLEIVMDGSGATTRTWDFGKAVAFDYGEHTIEKGAWALLPVAFKLLDPATDADIKVVDA